MTKQTFSIAKLYHERTKYDPETINQRVPDIDWERPPVPFKDYPIGTRIDLKPHIGDRQTVLSRLSHLLYCTYGLTARIPQMAQQDLLLRAAPSAGGLYPAEVYLLSRGRESYPQDGTTTRCETIVWCASGMVTPVRLWRRLFRTPGP